MGVNIPGWYYLSHEACDITTPILNRMTDTSENITFPQLRWRVVITKKEEHTVDFHKNTVIPHGI